MILLRVICIFTKKIENFIHKKCDNGLLVSFYINGVDKEVDKVRKIVYEITNSFGKFPSTSFPYVLHILLTQCDEIDGMMTKGGVRLTRMSKNRSLKKIVHGLEVCGKNWPR